MALPGHSYSIPYHFTEEETEQFLEDHWNDAKLINYLEDRMDPPYGIIVRDGYGDILVWIDPAGGELHVVDITNMNLAKEIQKAPFESPDSSYIDNLIEQVKATAAAGANAALLLGVVAVAVLAMRA